VNIDNWTFDDLVEAVEEYTQLKTIPQQPQQPQLKEEDDFLDVSQVADTNFEAFAKTSYEDCPQ
jgi:hypothetical protein